MIGKEVPDLEISFMTEDELSKIIIGLAIKVHRALGPGLLESAYEQCLFYELRKSGLKVERQRPLMLIYEDVTLDCAYKLDIIVEDKVIVEIKAILELTDIDLAQTLTHLKLSNCKLGLLINFNVLLLKQGIRRVVNNL